MTLILFVEIRLGRHGRYGRWVVKIASIKNIRLKNYSRMGWNGRRMPINTHSITPIPAFNDDNLKQLYFGHGEYVIGTVHTDYGQANLWIKFILKYKKIVLVCFPYSFLKALFGWWKKRIVFWLKTVIEVN